MEKPAADENLRSGSNILLYINLRDGAPEEAFVTVEINDAPFLNSSEKAVRMLVPGEDDFYRIVVRTEIGGKVVEEVQRRITIGDPRGPPTFYFGNDIAPK